ncbi:MAG: hypothetical protein K9M75_09865 [Phycisphaerae bacterium]|nr:hypothetical protein [Phycisphaerae bacterium]
MSKNDTETNEEGFVERRQDTVERRVEVDRRKNIDDTYEGLSGRGSVVDRRLGMDRRRGPGIRRSPERKAAEEGEMNDEQFEFLLTIDRYKRENKKPFPTWTEVLDVIKAMGYRKVADPQSINSFKEQPDLQPVG